MDAFLETDDVIEDNEVVDLEVRRCWNPENSDTISAMAVVTFILYYKGNIRMSVFNEQFIYNSQVDSSPFSVGFRSLFRKCECSLVDSIIVEITVYSHEQKIAKNMKEVVWNLHHSYEK